MMRLAVGLCSTSRQQWQIKLRCTSKSYNPYCVQFCTGDVPSRSRARELGASLIVALNTDASVKRLGKGDDRPLNNDADRAVLMASQQAVDLVTWFGEDTPLQIIGEIRPDILVKGGDYDMDTLAEAALVRSWGGRAMVLPFVAGYSTTQILEKIRAS